MKEGPDTLETRWVVIAMIPEGLVLEEEIPKSIPRQEAPSAEDEIWPTTRAWHCKVP